jgi:hypothetical protein
MLWFIAVVAGIVQGRKALAMDPAKIWKRKSHRFLLSVRSAEQDAWLDPGRIEGAGVMLRDGLDWRRLGEDSYSVLVLLVEKPQCFCAVYANRRHLFGFCR